MGKLRIVAMAGMMAGTLALAHASAQAAGFPDPADDAKLAAAPGSQTAIFSGGCFWGIQAVFEHVKGVTKATAGYEGGSAEDAHYMVVSTGRTGHAESVLVTFDPSVVTYGQLLKVFFQVAHNPTQLNYQGPDEGTQYRSAVWPTDIEQGRIAKAYIAQLDAAHVFPKAIVTQINLAKPFYAAEGYHQDYLVRNPDQPYIVYNDLPKLADLKRSLPDLWVEYHPAS